MFNANDFSDRLAELIFDFKLNATSLARKINTTKVTISRYLNKQRIPTIEILLKIADFFNVSIDFLLGSAQESNAKIFKDCPQFPERIKFLLDYFHVTIYRLEKDTHIDDVTIYAWLKGKSKPSLENIIKLSTYFNYSVDFILGRES